MEFRFETVYSQEAVTAMAKALRKAMRNKRSRRSRIFGVLITVLALFLALRDLSAFSFRSGVTLLAALILAFTLLFEDKLNGYVARKRMLPGMHKSVCVFTEENYTSTTEVGASVFPYENVAALAEDDKYFFFLFSLSHAQVYDKRTLTGGTAEEFRTFIERRCGKETVNIR